MSVKRVPAASIQRPMTIIAQDPAVLTGSGEVLTTQIWIPAERLSAGPWGYRIQVVDYNATNGEYYAPWDYEQSDGFVDPYAGKNAERLIADPKFHAQNVFAISMRILARFEYAFGHRVPWRFPSHQLKIAPHAFEDANAYYDRRTESLQFGYFPNRDESGYVFSCLSHDIVAHETTHAILDSIQSQYVYPSSPDQSAFHEAFSDIVALLSVFALNDVVSQLISRSGLKKVNNFKVETFFTKDVSISAMRKSLLLGLAEQFGDEIKTVRGSPLRQSLMLKPSKKYLDQEEFQEPHRRGEILVASVMNAFLYVFEKRIQTLDVSGSGLVSRDRVVEEAAKTADHLLTIVIRAIDYCVPVHLTFGNFLSALITSDSEIVGDDSFYGYRSHLLGSFEAFGILPESPQHDEQPGAWHRCHELDSSLNYNRAHFRELQSDYQEVFRFLWENRKLLSIRDDIYTRVIDVRPCLRISPEGFPLRETIVQYVQIADVAARELWPRFRVKKPGNATYPMKPDTRVTMHGGGTLVFDQYGRLKYNIVNRVDGSEQSARLEYLWQRGYFRNVRPMVARGFDNVHRLRSLRMNSAEATSEEAWL